MGMTYKFPYKESPYIIVPAVLIKSCKDAGVLNELGNWPRAYKHPAHLK